MKCRLDGMTILIGTGSFADQEAQEKGFCGEGCESVYDAQKASDLKAAANG